MGNCNFCFRATFGPIWTNFTCFRPIFGPIWTILPVSDKNLSKLDQKLVWNRKIAFSYFGTQQFPVDAQKKFFWVYLNLFVAILNTVPKTICTPLYLGLILKSCQSDHWPRPSKIAPIYFTSTSTLEYTHTY